ncbi:MAG: hypothetical protein AB7P49_09915, partial [Bdellovibrionales bacterium]
MFRTNHYLFSILIFAATLVATPLAGAETTPPDLCAEDPCTPAMESVFEEFTRTQTAPQVADLPQVFSGECYNSGYYSDASQPSYGLTLLDPMGSDIMFGALFTFGPTANPHIELDVPKARETLKSGSSSPKTVSQQSDLYNVEYRSGSSSINYWMRINPQTGDLLLVKLGVYNDG